MAKQATEQHDGTRERILAAAREIALERGYKGTTIAMIQKRAGVHPGSLYWYFADKDALFAGLVESAYQGTQSSAFAPDDADPNPILQVLRQIVDNPRRHGLWRFNVQLMLDPDRAESRTARVIRGMRRDSQRGVLGALRLPPEALEASPGLEQSLADFALVTVEGCLLARVAGRPVDDEGVTRRAQAVIDGMVDRACRDAGVPTPDSVLKRLADSINGKVDGHGVA